MKKRERKPAAELPADHIVSSPGVGNDDAVLFRDAIREWRHWRIPAG